MSLDLDSFIGAYSGESRYDFDNKIILSWYPHRIVERAGSAGSLLELGLGHGYTTDLFSRHFRRHLVLDGSRAVIDNFRANNPDCSAEIVETYFETFDTEERFDIIVMGFILEHVDDPIKIMSRFQRFLNPKGKLFVAVPNAEVLNRRLGKFAGLLHDIKELSDHDRLLGHQRYYTVESLTKDIGVAGCKVDMMEGIFLKPFTSSQLRSLELSESIIQALCLAGLPYPELSCGILAQISPR